MRIENPRHYPKSKDLERSIFSVNLSIDLFIFRYRIISWMVCTCTYNCLTLSHIASVYCMCHLLDITYVKTVLAKYKPYVVIPLPCCFQFLKKIIVIFYNWLEAVTTITIGMCENFLDHCDTVTNGMLWSLDIE